MQIKIDDIVYILNPSPPKLIPAKVIEQVITRNSSGEITRNIVELPTGKSYTLEKITKNIFLNLEDAKRYMLDEASRLVEKVVEDCLEYTQKSFTTSENHKTELPQTEILEQVENNPSDKVVVELPNGAKANVTIPEILLN